MTTVVVNWSGGPDSTAALQYLLANTDHHVIALHTDGDESSLIANELEQKAIDTLYPILTERYREFDLYHINHSRSEKFAAWCGEPSLYPLFLFLRGVEGKIYSGRCREDGDLTKYNDFWATQKKMFDMAGVELVHFNSRTPKRQIRRDLGDLWDLTFSCFYPKRDGSVCGKCKKCYQRSSTDLKRRY